MMTGSLPSSSSSSTTSSNGSLRPGPGANQDDQFVDDLVSRLLKEDTEDDLVSGLNSLLKQTLSDGNGVNNGFDEPSLFLSKHWSKSQYVQPVNHQSQQPPFGRNNNNLESLKIFTSELAENLGNGGGINGTGNNGINGGGNGSQRHHDSGYISPNFPPNSSNGSGGGNGKAFFDGPNNPGHQAVNLEHQPPVDPVLLQQVLQQQQQQQHPKQQPQQPMINHRPITGARNHHRQHQHHNMGPPHHHQHGGHLAHRAIVRAVIPVNRANQPHLPHLPHLHLTPSNNPCRDIF